jgi:hypothetical protein
MRVCSARSIEVKFSFRGFDARVWALNFPSVHGFAAQGALKSQFSFGAFGARVCIAWGIEVKIFLSVRRHGFAARGALKSHIEIKFTFPYFTLAPSARGFATHGALESNCGFAPHGGAEVNFPLAPSTHGCGTEVIFPSKDCIVILFTSKSRIFSSKSRIFSSKSLIFSSKSLIFVQIK